MKRLCFLLCLAFAGLAAAGTIKVAQDATQAEKQAVSDFAAYYKMITGASLYDKKNPLTVYIGKAAKEAKWFTPREGKREQWFIESNGDELVITGDIRGTVWGVYEFLEKYMGCAFLAPDTEIVPSNPGWKVPAIKETFTPAIFRRALDMSSPRIYTGQAQLRLKSSIRTNFPEIRLHHGSPSGSHTAAKYSSAWMDENAPFARTSKGTVRKNSYCSSSPEAAKRIAEQMCSYIEKDRKGLLPEQWPIIYDLSQNDGADAFCHCPECERRRGKNGSCSDLNNEFVNQVADIVGAKYPDVLIQTFAYNNTLPAPEKVKARPNVVIRFCNSTITNPLREGTPAGENLKKWTAMAYNLAIWGYWKTYTGTVIGPYVIPRANMQRELQFCRDNKVLFYYGENEGPYHRSFYTFQYYMGHHLMVDPDADVEKLTDTFFNGYFGKAASVMRQYLEYLEECHLSVESLKRTIQGMSGDSMFFMSYCNQEFFDKANALLDEAERLTAEDARSNLHVRWERIPVDQIHLLNQDKFPMKDKARSITRYMDTLAELYSNTSDSGWKKTSLERKLDSLKSETEIYKRMPFAIPEQFKDKKMLSDLHWPDFHPWGGAGRCLVADKEAASGSTYELRRDRKHRHGAPFKVVMYHSVNRKEFKDVIFRLDKDMMPKDEKYHWYRVGSTVLDPDVRLSCGPGNAGGIDIHLSKAVSGIIRPEKEVWISLKVTGPAYVDGSTLKDGVFVERVIVFEK